jgi:cadmium resistance protein CadD (predicted permease)
LDSILVLAGITLLSFVGTNLDNLLLLVGFAARPGQRFAAIRLGALLSGAVLLTLCLGSALAADLVPTHWIGFLGVVPIGLGLRELHRLAATRPEGPLVANATTRPLSGLGIASVMLANSADSLAALLPLFAETETGSLPVLVAVVLATTLLGCELARRLATSRRMGALLRRVGPVLVPIALIAVGVYVLLDTRTDTEHAAAVHEPRACARGIPATAA